MDLRQLRNFLAMAEQGNISQIAKKIHLTQFALSRKIKALENEVGHSLLARQAHSIRLTSTGEVLLWEGRELLHHADQVLERVRIAGTECACESAMRHRSRPSRTSLKNTQERTWIYWISRPRKC